MPASICSSSQPVLIRLPKSGLNLRSADAVLVLPTDGAETFVVAIAGWIDEIDEIDEIDVIE